MSAEKNDSAKVLERLIRLCDDLAWAAPPMKTPCSN